MIGVMLAILSRILIMHGLTPLIAAMAGNQLFQAIAGPGASVEVRVGVGVGVGWSMERCVSCHGASRETLE